MIEIYEEQAWEFSQSFKRISPILFMRKFKLNFDCALNLCHKIWRKRHVEAREFAKEFNRTM